jgi:hypothetical protein
MRALANVQKIDWVERLEIDIAALHDKKNLLLVAWGGMQVPPVEMKNLYGWDV